MCLPFTKYPHLEKYIYRPTTWKNTNIYGNFIGRVTRYQQRCLVVNLVVYELISIPRSIVSSRVPLSNGGSESVGGQAESVFVRTSGVQGRWSGWWSVKSVSKSDRVNQESSVRAPCRVHSADFSLCTGGYPHPWRR